MHGLMCFVNVNRCRGEALRSSQVCSNPHRHACRLWRGFFKACPVQHLPNWRGADLPLQSCALKYCPEPNIGRIQCCTHWQMRGLTPSALAPTRVPWEVLWAHLINIPQPSRSIYLLIFAFAAAFSALNGIALPHSLPLSFSLKLIRNVQT